LCASSKPPTGNIGLGPALRADPQPLVAPFSPTARCARLPCCFASATGPLLRLSDGAAVDLRLHGRGVYPELPSSIWSAGQVATDGDLARRHLRSGLTEA
jgi:hypothetical protein